MKFVSSVAVAVGCLIMAGCGSTGGPAPIPTTPGFDPSLFHPPPKNATPAPTLRVPFTVGWYTNISGGRERVIYDNHHQLHAFVGLYGTGGAVDNLYWDSCNQPGGCSYHLPLDASEFNDGTTPWWSAPGHFAIRSLTGQWYWHNPHEWDIPLEAEILNGPDDNVGDVSFAVPKAAGTYVVFWRGHQFASVSVSARGVARLGA